MNRMLRVQCIVQSKETEEVVISLVDKEVNFNIKSYEAIWSKTAKEMFKAIEELKARVSSKSINPDIDRNSLLIVIESEEFNILKITKEIPMENFYRITAQEVYDLLCSFNSGITSTNH